MLDNMMDKEPERYYDWILWKLRQERKKEGIMSGIHSSPYVKEVLHTDHGLIDDKKIKNLPQDIQDELFIITTEECSELSKECMKYLRWGMDKKRRQNLISELGDVKCMIDLMVEFGVISEQELEDSTITKRNKLKKWSKLFNEPE